MTFSSKDDKIGMRGIPSCSITFKDVSISEMHLLGEEGDGFKIAMETLNRSRPAVGAQALGIAESAMETATLFAMRRRQFGKPIAKAGRHAVYAGGDGHDDRISQGPGL